MRRLAISTQELNFWQLTFINLYMESIQPICWLNVRRGGAKEQIPAGPYLGNLFYAIELQYHKYFLLNYIILIDFLPKALV